METPEQGAGSLLALMESQPGSLPEQLRLAQQLMEALPVPVFFKGRDGRYLGVNKAWEQFFGVSREQMLGATARDLYAHAPTVADRHNAMDAALWDAPGTQSYELAISTPDGQLRHTIYYKATFLGANGKVAGLIGTIIDITDRKRSEQRDSVENAVARFLGGTEPLHDAIRGIIQVFCERLDFACGARWSLDEEENRLRCIETWSVEDPGIKAFLATSSRATFIPGRSGLIREVLASGKSVWIADVTARPDFLRAGIARDAGLRGAFALPVMVGERVLGAVEFFSREVREPDDWLLQIAMSAGRQIGQLMARRQAEAAMLEANAALEVQAKELKRSNEELQQFAYVASHDLQEPLRMISSYTQLLARRHGDKLDGDARDFMEFIVDGAARMKQLIEDLLEYSRVGTRGRELELVESGGALDRALANLTAAREATSAEVTRGPLPAVHADPVQLTQLFQNLIGNAIKFRGEEIPRIHVECEAHPDSWAFTVRDNGIGLDPEFSERIFMMFQRLHGKDEYPGTGIGLAICKKIAERHGGRIWVDSQPGRGATFGFTIARPHTRNNK